MKGTVKVCSVISLVAAALLAVLGLITTFNTKGMFVGLAMFNMMKRGTFLGYIGNIVGVLGSAYGFGSMGFFGFRFTADETKAKPAFMWGIAMTAVCALSLVMSIFAKSFSFGDIILLALPAVYTFAVYKTA